MSEQSLFPTTKWTFVIEVIQKGDEAQALEKIGLFYEQYQAAIRTFFRIKGADADGADDLTQEFFHAKILTHNGGLIARADRHRARFRTFLRGCLDDFWKDQLRRGGAVKRGNHAPHVPIEQIQMNEPGALPFVPPEDDDGFDAAFAEALLAQVCPAEDRKLLDALVEETRRGALAKEWDMSEGAVKTALSRFRNRFEAEVRQEVRRTLGPDATDAEVREEIELLMKALARNAVTSPGTPADKPEAGVQPSSADAENDGSKQQRPNSGGPLAGPGEQAQAP